MTIPSRMTQRLMVERSLASLQGGLARLARTQEQLHTGRIINRPSDSPTGTNTAMRLRAETAAQTQYTRNAQDGLGWLGQLDSTITSMLDRVNKVRDLALQGASTGSTSQQAREALASEAEQIRSDLLARANSQHLGRPIFGGTTAGKQAYDPATGGYLGEPVAGPGTTVQRSVADGVSVRVDMTGPEVFGNGPDALFAVIDDVVRHLRTDPAALSGDLDRLDTALQGMRTAVADVGTRYARLEQATQTAKDTTLELQASLSEVENVDLAKAMMDLQMQEVAYQGALATTARVLQPSLIDFLR
ncbi:MAG: flagellar hook-associated protein FlgL [Actinomycetota bacterium]|nr:flagellar hook-associated protein FlgL [Actinomycetota bacterium]